MSMRGGVSGLADGEDTGVIMLYSGALDAGSDAGMSMGTEVV
jgi:hypothetical protein